MTRHYNPITQPMFREILVSLLWLDSFYFIVEFIKHTSHLPIWNSHASRASRWWKNLFASVPTQIIRKAHGLICRLIKNVSFLSVRFTALLEEHMELPHTIQRMWPFTPASHSPWHLKEHQPQICTLSSRPSSQSFSPSHSHCLAMHLFFEQANWFHKHDESAEGIGRGNFNAINQTKWGGNNNKSCIPYWRARVFLIKTQQVGRHLFAPWLACFHL